MLRLHCLFFLFVNPLLLLAQIEWHFEDYYQETMLYIHPIANYDFHPEWYQEWENNSFRSNIVRLNFASISMSELFSDAQLVVNEQVLKNLWFRYEYIYYATHHQNEQQRSSFMGFEKNIYRYFSLFVYGNPHFEKENIDVQYGFSLANQKRTRYFRFAYVQVDPFWDQKNDVNSSSIKKPWEIVWTSHLSWKKIRLFANGRYDNGYQRKYINNPIEPLLAFRQKRTNSWLVKINYFTTKTAFFELKYDFYEYYESKAFLNDFNNYDYKNQINMYKIAYITPIFKNKLRLGIHFIDQNANSELYHAHKFYRREAIPFLFWQMFWGPGALEMGYMISFYKWDYSTLDKHSYVDHYVDKIKLGYTFNIKNKAYLQFAVSHVTTIWGFGGGNVQYFMTF